MFKPESFPRVLSNIAAHFDEATLVVKEYSEPMIDC